MMRPLNLGRQQTGIFAYSSMDILPVLAGIGHLSFVVWLVTGFPQRAWWQNALLGLCYSWSIAWNINGVSHNFLHTPYFRAQWLNRAFSIVESLANGFSQTIYTAIHLRHHTGNSDRPDENGQTADPLSIYRHGEEGRAEPLWRYVWLGALRDDAPGVFSEMKRKRPAKARWAMIELAALALFVIAGLAIDWRAVLSLLPFYYLGNALSQLSGYYEHYNANPDEPIAWGVSSTAPLYNLIWFGNGFHAEHHYRPSLHWTKLSAFHRLIAGEQRAKQVHVIGTAHWLGFLACANRTAIERP